MHWTLTHFSWSLEDSLQDDVRLDQSHQIVVPILFGQQMSQERH